MIGERERRAKKTRQGSHALIRRSVDGVVVVDGYIDSGDDVMGAPFADRKKSGSLARGFRGWVGKGRGRAETTRVRVGHLLMIITRKQHREK